MTMTLELPNMIYMNTNLDKLLKKISQLESGEQVSLSFKNIEFILPESTILLLSISKQIYDRTHTSSNLVRCKERYANVFRTYTNQ